MTDEFIKANSQRVQTTFKEDVVNRGGAQAGGEGNCLPKIMKSRSEDVMCLLFLLT